MSERSLHRVRVLVADVGGTKIDFARYDLAHEPSPLTTAQRPRPLRTARVGSAEQSSLQAAASVFLAGDRIDCAVLAIAGPVVDGSCQLTNLPWRVERETMQRELGAPVELINDFAALGYAVPWLTSDDLLSLASPPRPARAPVAILGAGTGLGQAIGVWSGDRLEVVAGEGGHADFAPRDELEVGLWRALAARHGRVSWERVLSGHGLLALYTYLCDCAQAKGASTGAPRATSPAEVSARALDGQSTDAIAATALARWLSMYGAEAGNLALRAAAYGGLFIAGGIAPKLGERLRAGELMSAFVDKGRMRTVLERVPVDVIMSADASLLGALARALVIYRPS